MLHSLPIHPQWCLVARNSTAPLTALHRERLNNYGCRPPILGPSVAREHHPGLTFTVTDGLWYSMNLGHTSRDLRSLGRFAAVAGPSLTNFLIGKAYLPAGMTQVRIAARSLNLSIVKPANNRVHCFDFIAQPLVHSADLRSAAQERAATLDHCKLQESAPDARYMTLLARKNTRMFSDNANYTARSRAFFEATAARLGLSFREVFFEGVEFCDQVAIMASTQVLVTVHGAAVEGTGLFLPQGAFILELFAKFLIPTANGSAVAGPPLLHANVLVDKNDRNWFSAIGLHHIAVAALEFPRKVASTCRWRELGWMYYPGCFASIDFAVLGEIIEMRHKIAAEVALQRQGAGAGEEVRSMIAQRFNWSSSRHY